ncbi:hypothetical protein T439DRAFT_333601 [Meredithblackwellia eburnea MCA 4105]
MAQSCRTGKIGKQTNRPPSIPRSLIITTNNNNNKLLLDTNTQRTTRSKTAASAMAAALVSSAHQHQHQNHHPSHQADLDEDLMSLLASDSFSLASKRDRDLDILSSLLQSSLPNHHAHAQWIAGSAGPQPHIHNNAQSGPSSATAATATWNGWSPSNSSLASGYYAPAGSLNSAYSGSYQSGGILIGGSASFSTPHGTPLTATTALPSPSTYTSTNPLSSASSNSDYWRRAEGFATGTRAPAHSRERGDGAGRERSTSYGAAGAGLPTTQELPSWQSASQSYDDDARMDDD